MKPKSKYDYKDLYRNFNNWAEVYDLAYAAKPKTDVNFYVKEAARAKGKVLEVACGTGRIYLELLQKGVDAYGMDVSASMLKVLKTKARKLKLQPKVFKANMRNFRSKHKFALIMVPFRSFLHNLNIEDQVQALENFKRHLKPGGKLILNFLFPKPEFISKFFNREFKVVINTKQGRFIQVNRNWYCDEINQIVEFTQELRKNKTIWKGRFKIAHIRKREFELLLMLAGFKKWKVFGDFNYQPLRSTKQEMVWIVN